MNSALAFLTSPLGIAVVIVAALLAGRFLWHVLVGALHLVLVVAIVGVVLYGLGVLRLPDDARPITRTAVHYRVRT
jgi:hypothetical protein